MAQNWATSFYHSPAWRRVRSNYMSTILDTSGHVLMMHDNGAYFYVDDQGHENDVPPSCVIAPGMCERCMKMGHVEPAKVVHHIQHLTPTNINDRKITLSYSNLQRLCQDCHAAVHSAGSARRVQFDSNGHIIKPDSDDEFRRQIMHLTESVDERRNIYKEKNV